MGRLINIIGQRFGRLVVLRRKESSRQGISWECICDCGKVKTVRGTSLRHGYTTSCGCYSHDAAKARLTKHGFSSPKDRSPSYFLYRGMIYRCHNPKSKDYKHYGGRGITVCDRWLESYLHFLEDMGHRPKGLQLDRVDNSKGYSKENCRWATPIVNANNKRNNVIICHDGVSKTIAEWAKIVPIPEKTLRARLDAGWPYARILSEPVNSASECAKMAHTAKKKGRQAHAA